MRTRCLLNRETPRSPSSRLSTDVTLTSLWKLSNKPSTEPLTSVSVLPQPSPVTEILSTKCTFKLRLEITVGGGETFRWVPFVGLALIKYVEVEIGGQRIDKHYGEWMYLWNELTQSVGRLKRDIFVWQVMYQNLSDSKPWASVQPSPKPRLWIPLEFWFNRNPGLGSSPYSPSIPRSQD